MGDRYHQNQPHQSHHTSATNMLCATLAGVALGGPLLGLMGFSFLSAATLVLVTSPLLLIFSPLLFCAALLLAGALAGFAAAVAMAVGGLCALSLMFREVRKLVDFRGERMKEEGRGFGGYLQRRMPENSAQYTRLIQVE